MTKSKEEAAVEALAADKSTNFTVWPDSDLVDAYRRHSEVLIRYGFDLELAHRMGLIEEELRDRAIDPEGIIQELWNSGRGR